MQTVRLRTTSAWQPFNGRLRNALQMGERTVADVCPLMVPRDLTFRNYAGHVDVKGHRFWVKLSLPEDGTIKNAKFEFDWQLNILLKGYQDALHQKLSECTTIIDLLEQFKEFVGYLLQTKDIPEVDHTPRSTFYEQVLAELEDVGWEKVRDIDVDFSTIKFKTRDALQREHSLDVHVTPQYPAVPPVCHADLPLLFVPKWSQKCTLKTVMDQFESLGNSGNSGKGLGYRRLELSRYQLFWSTLDEIDQKTWVLSPDQNNRATRTRHFAIGKNLSIQVSLNPLSPCAVPEYKLLGPEKYIVKLHENLSRHLENWSEDASLLTNLEQAFGQCIPSREDIKREDVVRGCGVCFVDDDEEVPDIFCNNERCLQVFHKKCLVQWIRTRPESRMSFDTLFGRCPYCQQPLQVHI